MTTIIAAGERLRRLIQHGDDEYILTSTAGTLSLHVRLSLPGARARLGGRRTNPVRVDWPRATVIRGPNRVALSPTELRLLVALLEANGRPVPRATLIARVWSSQTTAERENALAVYVCALRKHLTAIGLGDALTTVRGIGYRLGW